MYYIVTGAAGFIGSRLVAALNRAGIDEILVVDNLEHGDKFRNLAGCEFEDYLDKREFMERLAARQLDGGVEAVFHQGACSDTMETNGRYMMDNNYRCSREILDWCAEEEVPLVYASSAAVYGSGQVFVETREHEAPLNVYGWSKCVFDRLVRRRLPETENQIVGLRYFNVYGPNEAHKGRMASVACHAFRQFRDEGRVRLFVGSGGYGDGEQRRDFVHVDDVVAANLWFLDHRDVSGIFNCGTGRAQTFNEVAAAVVNGVRASRGEPPLELAAMVKEGLVEYVPFPPALLGRYQSYTQADLSRLRAAGCDTAFRDVAEGVAGYVRDLSGTP